jgi:hypothetical protein
VGTGTHDGSRFLASCVCGKARDGLHCSRRTHHHSPIVGAEKFVNRRLFDSGDRSGQDGNWYGGSPAALIVKREKKKEKEKGASPVERRRVKREEVVVGRDKEKDLTGHESDVCRPRPS